MPTTPAQAVQGHGGVPSKPMHQPRQILGIGWLKQHVKVVSHQAQPINLHGKFLLGLFKYRQQHITPKGFGNQELPAIAAQRDMKTATR